MQIIEGLDQDTIEWHLFRQSHIGASDSGTIMFPNKYRKIKDLWEEKVFGWEKEFNKKSLDRMKKGKDLEPKAREFLSKKIGIKLNPLVAVSEKHSFISASLDGIDENYTIATEIKCGNKAYELAKLLTIDDTYYSQIQHQMFVTGLNLIHYFCYLNDNENILIDVPRDENFINTLIDKEIVFWQHVETSTVPRY